MPSVSLGNVKANFLEKKIRIFFSYMSAELAQGIFNIMEYGKSPKISSTLFLTFLLNP